MAGVRVLDQIRANTASEKSGWVGLVIIYFICSFDKNAR